MSDEIKRQSKIPTISIDSVEFEEPQVPNIPLLLIESASCSPTSGHSSALLSTRNPSPRSHSILSDDVFSMTSSVESALGMRVLERMHHIMMERAQHGRASSLRRRLSTRSSDSTHHDDEGMESRKGSILTPDLHMTTEAQRALLSNVVILDEVCAAIEAVVSWTQCYTSRAIVGVLVQSIFMIVFVSISLVSIYSIMGCIGKYGLSFDGGTVTRFVLLTHFLQCLLSVYYIGKTNYNLPDFLRKWMEAYSGVSDEHVPLKEIMFCSKVFNSYMLIGTIFFGIFSASTWFELGDVVSLPDNCTCFVFLGYEYRWINCILVALATVPNLYMQALYGILCFVIYYEFRHFGQRFSKLHSSENPEQEVEIFRNQHLKMVELTDLLDDTVSYYIWWVFCLNLPAFSAILYALMLDDSLTNSRAIALAIWAVQLIIQFVIISTTPVFLIDEAYAPLSLIDHFSNRPAPSADQPVSDQPLTPRRYGYWMSIECYRQINAFHQQLRGRQIGITCAGFTLLSKELLLTVISILITYFTLVIQLQMSASSVCNCDCSNQTKVTNQTIF